MAFSCTRERHWPTNRDDLVHIYYCYKDWSVRNHVRYLMDGATQSWYHHLGRPASPQSRHKIVFTERVDSWNNPQFYSDMLSNDKDAWNPFMSYQTVAVTWVANEGNYSLTGYWDHGKSWDMKLNVGLSRIDNTVHELGHVMSRT